MNIADLLLPFVTLIISLTFHEASHALFAMLGGDRTAYYAGQVTLNPIPHIRREPFGTIVLPLVSLLSTNGTMCLGYAHAPIDPNWAYHHPRKAAVMSLAGPLANVLLAAIAFVILWFIAVPHGDTERTIRTIARSFLYLNVLLAVFNLIPLPPLDGAGVVQGLHPPARRFYERLQEIPYASIVTFVVLIFVLPYLFIPVFNTVDGWLPHSTRFG